MNSDETLKRLNALFAKMYSEEDYKGALAVQVQIHAIEKQAANIAESEKLRKESFLK